VVRLKIGFMGLLVLITAWIIAILAPYGARFGYSVDRQEHNDDLNLLWHYQLQNTEYGNLVDLNVRYIVVDPDDANITREQLLELRRMGKIVLAYLSIGEAENYRDYWKPWWQPGNPDFVADENPNWRGNFKVRFWDPRWEEIVMQRLMKIVTQGYSGAYLDIVDAYEYWEDRNVPDAAIRMVRLVWKISTTAKSINPEFLIVPQNAIELYRYPEYRAAIDGVGKEDTWHVGDVKRNPRDVNWALKYLRWIRNDGKFILAIDYPENRENICAFYRNCFKEDGFYCTVSNRELNLPRPVTCKK